MEKETYGFQKTWEEVVEMKGKVAALLQKAEIRRMNPIVIDKLSEVKKAMEELDGIMSKINLDGIMANINKGANNGRDRDKKIFLLDKTTFPDAMTFTENQLEEMVASDNYFDDDIVKIDANGYDTVHDAIKGEWGGENVFEKCFVASFGFNNNGANNGRDKKIFLLDKMTFPDALNFSGSEDELEVMIASNSYFDDDIVKIDANGYDSVKEAIEEELKEDLNLLSSQFYIITFGFKSNVKMG